ncbi:SET and MYND domain-containing protein (SMYD)-like protein [Leptotrombidium deliense]|uniref:Protein-lysine N-methyltransferase SMYD4 n=1 Tax=Leptotrombidium deliense TaxID=299467 RepID=A0A443S863_9ACAR|nr:SET and MYND domain-containing protein (SMYD)-like protein [Leptotrombidium deliense]
MPSEKLKNSIELLRSKLELEHQDADWGLFQVFTDFMFQFSFSEKSEAQRSDFMDKFGKLTSNEKKVEFILNDENCSKLITTLVDDFLENREERDKNAAKAKSLRESGNQCFREKRYEEAVQQYSDAIAFAPFSSHYGNEECSELSLSLANRSAALYSLKRFKESLKDIDRCVTFGYLPNRCHLLFARKILALRALQRDSEANQVIDEMIEYVKNKITEDKLQEMQEFVKQSLQQKITIAENFDQKKLQTELESHNELLANASSCIHVNYTPEKGRHILAKRDISASEVLISEEPFAVWLKPSFHNEFCAHCLKNLNAVHFPCKHCSIARYCDENCATLAWDTYHSIECEHIDILYTLSCGQLALRTLLAVGIDESIKIAAEKLTTKDNCGVYKADYTSILSLVDHSDLRSVESICSFSVGAAFLVILFQKMSLISVPVDKFYFFGGLLLKHILQFQCNSCSVTYDDSQQSVGHQTLSSQLKVIGTAIYPTLALFNHSCDNFVYPLFDGSKITIKSTNYVKVGEEVTFNYGFHYQKMSFKDRQEALKLQYFFDCHCKMCEKKMENIGQAFRCKFCEGALIVNKDESNYCVTCNKCCDNLEELKERFDSCCLLLFKGFEYFHQNNSRAKEVLLSSLHTLNEIVYKNHELLAETHEKLAKYFEQEYNYTVAAKHWYSMYKILVDIFGEVTYDALNCLLSIALCLIEEAKAGDVKKMYENAVKARKYFSRAVKISDRLKGKEYNVLTSIEAASRSIELMPIVSSYFSLFDK